MAVDRRVARTRTALFDALVRLIRQKPYETITVEDILREADVGRATFYAHFTSKDELLEKSLERLKALLLAASAATNGTAFSWSQSRALFEHVAEYSDVQMALAGGRGRAIVREAVDAVVGEVIRAGLPPQRDLDLPRELVVRHMVSTFDTVFAWWRERRPAMLPVEADALYARLLREALPAAAVASFIGEAAAGPAVSGRRSR